MRKKDKLIKIDIGCGNNKKNGFIGIDINKNSQADIIASACDLPLVENSVDEIYSAHLVEHFYPNEAEKFFSEIYRVLKKGAKTFLKIDTDWTKKRLLKKDSTHKYRYSIEEIKEILSHFNFSQSRVKRKIYLINHCYLRNKIFVELIK